MSIILKALKKSEAQRRLGKAPTLADTAAISNVEEKPKRTSWPWLALGFMILLTAGWFGRGWIPLGSDNEEQSAGSISPQQVRTRDAEVDTSLDDIARDAKAQLNQLVPKTSANSTTSPNIADFSTPVESYSTPESAYSEDATTLSGSGTVANESQVDVDTASVWPEPVQAGKQVGTEPLSIYEIPREIRAGLPEFQIIMQVYANEPENRFALVNGVHITEGNELSAGLVLIEIRQQGLVFSYRDYRFLVGD